MEHPPLVIAHRGASAYAPEHTFAAWDMALDMGADYLEQDLQMTADGVLVVLHDATLDRTVRGPGGVARGPVAARTSAELAACSAGRWFNEAFPERARPAFEDEPVPTLEAVLERYRGRARFYIETKKPDEAPGMEEALLALLDHFGLRRTAGRDWSVLIQSFSEASLRKLHRADPSLPLVQLMDRNDPRTALGYPGLQDVAHYAVGIGPHHRDVTPGLAATARALCLEVHPYTVDDPDRMAELLGAGVTGLFTNRPDTLVQLLGRDASGAPDGGAPGQAARAWRACREGG